MYATTSISTTPRKQKVKNELSKSYAQTKLSYRGSFATPRTSRSIQTPLTVIIRIKPSQSKQINYQTENNQLILNGSISGGLDKFEQIEETRKYDFANIIKMTIPIWMILLRDLKTQSIYRS